MGRKPLLEKKRIRKNIAISPEMDERLGVVSTNTGKSMSKIIEEALVEHLDRIAPRKPAV